MNSSVGIFDTLVERQLTGTWLKRKAELDRQKYQPYADLLLDEVVWPEVYATSDEIAASLTAKCSTASAPSELFVPIWSFNHADFHSKNRILSSLHHSPYTESLARMGNKDALFIQKIHQNNWLQWLEVNLKAPAQWEDERVLDLFITEADLSLLLSNWGASGVGDIDGDGTVGAAEAKSCSLPSFAS
jgi:hypothetical protein